MQGAGGSAIKGAQFGGSPVRCPNIQRLFGTAQFCPCKVSVSIGAYPIVQEGTPMSDWLVRGVAVFGYPAGQRWWFVALGLIAIGLFMTWKLDK